MTKKYTFDWYERLKNSGRTFTVDKDQTTNQEQLTVRIGDDYWTAEGQDRHKLVIDTSNAMLRDGYILDAEDHARGGYGWTVEWLWHLQFKYGYPFIIYRLADSSTTTDRWVVEVYRNDTWARGTGARPMDAIFELVRSHGFPLCFEE